MADRYEIREELDRHRYNQIADAKNQAWWEAERQRPVWTPGTIGAMAGLAVLFGTLLYPVSYTHLDVYKRQMLCCRFLCPLRCGLFQTSLFPMLAKLRRLYPFPSTPFF